jgi:hypothetical protein
MDVVFIQAVLPTLGISMCVSLCCHHRAFFSLLRGRCCLLSTQRNQVLDFGFAPKGEAGFDSFNLMTGAQNQRRQRANAPWRQLPSSASKCRCLEAGASAPFNHFVALEHVKDPNVQEGADAPNCRFCCSTRHSPPFRTLAKSSIANSTKSSAT